MDSRKRKKKRGMSAADVLMIIAAIGAVILAVTVVVSVFRKISQEDFQWEPVETKTTAAETVFSIDNDDVLGWIQTEEGRKFRNNDKTFAADQWKEEDGKLFYLKEDQLMAVGEMAMDGQIFKFSNEGELLDIQFDSLWKGNDGGPENSDSLVTSNAYWVYRYDADGSGNEFLPICYRKAADNQIKYLGGEENPEITTRNSIQVHDNWIYYLPQKKTIDSDGEYDDINKKLFRMHPGDTSKELLGENVTGYLVLGDTVYLASEGKIIETTSGVKYTLGDGQYNIIVRDDAFYMTDGENNLVEGSGEGFKVIGDRKYRVENGKIKYVMPADITKNGKSYYLSKGVLYQKSNDEQEKIVASAAFGIDSFCMADNWIYYSAYVEKDENGKAYSQLYRSDLDGQIVQKLSQKFSGNIQHMYYYKDNRMIYGEYSPTPGENALGKIAVISLDGTMWVMDDASVRVTAENEANGMMEIVMVKGEAVNAYLHTLRWDGARWADTKIEPVQITDREEGRKLTASSILAGGSEEPMETEPEETEPAETEPEETKQEETKPAETVPEIITPLEPGEHTRPTETIPPQLIDPQTQESEEIPIITPLG